MARQLTGKIERALAGGGTAAKAGGKMLLHYAKRPFLGAEARRRDREQAAGDSARVLFQGLSLLRGTALKMAQQLSLEMDLLPEAACRELAKAYHQVPPINRALVRQVVREALGRPPEAVFDHLDLTAFAAASLGQVHRARDADGTALAVKIQYPGIAKSIDSDMAMLRQILRPVIQSDQLRPMLAEASSRLHEEVDYLQEGGNLEWFTRHLRIAGVRVPRWRPELSAPTVLTTTCNDDCSGYYSDVFPNQMSRNLARDQRVCIMAVNCGMGYWLKGLLFGRFDHWPGIRLYGTVDNSRPAHPGEVERWLARVKRFKPFKGYDLIWKDIHTVRDIRFTHYEPVRVGAMTRHLMSVSP